MSTKVPAAIYIRCSSAQQELSVNQQREVLLPWAEQQNYKIVCEYVDEGKSASKDISKRIAFHKMVMDSAGQKFVAILCYDFARFSRLDHIDGSRQKQTLRNNGCYLDTFKDGKFDWRTADGRLRDVMFCEMSKSHSLNISRDSLRGRLDILKLGYWPTGVVPFGFDREYTDGERTVRVKRNEPYQKGRRWHLRLVVNDTEAKVIREIFKLASNPVTSLRQLAADLSVRKIPSPMNLAGSGGNAWTAQTLKSVLTDKSYIGVCVIGGRRKSKKEKFNQAELTERPGACPTIVTESLFNTVQSVLLNRSKSKAKPQTAKAGILSGFLVCGHCGYRMEKRLVRGKVHYTCASANKRKHSGCRQWRVLESETVSKICNWLLEEMGDRLVKALQYRPKEDGPKPELALIQERISQLERQIETGTKNALLSDRDSVKLAWQMVADWRNELEQNKHQLGNLTAKGSGELLNYRQWYEKNKGQLITLAETFSDNHKYSTRHHTDIQSFRTFLGQIGLKLTFWWRHNQEARKHNRRAFEFVLDKEELSIAADLGAILGEYEKDMQALSTGNTNSLFAFTAVRDVV